MPTITSDSRTPYTDTLERGNTLSVACSSTGSALVEILGPSRRTQPQNTVAAGVTKVFGPYQHDMQVKVSMLSGSAVVTEAIADELALPMTVVSSDAPSDSDGRPNGTIYIQTA